MGSARIGQSVDVPRRGDAKRTSLELRLVLVFLATATSILAALALIGGLQAYDVWRTLGASVLATLVYLQTRVDDRGRPKDK
jgi:hypothetical protein